MRGEEEVSVTHRTGGGGCLAKVKGQMKGSQLASCKRRRGGDKVSGSKGGILLRRFWDGADALLGPKERGDNEEKYKSLWGQGNTSTGKGRPTGLRGLPRKNGKVPLGVSPEISPVWVVRLAERREKEPPWGYGWVDNIIEKLKRHWERGIQ